MGIVLSVARIFFAASRSEVSEKSATSTDPFVLESMIRSMSPTPALAITGTPQAKSSASLVGEQPALDMSARMKITDACAIARKAGTSSRSTAAASLEAFVRANVKPGATLLTDGHSSYPGLTDYR